MSQDNDANDEAVYTSDFDVYQKKRMEYMDEKVAEAISTISYITPVENYTSGKTTSLSAIQNKVQEDMDRRFSTKINEFNNVILVTTT